MSGQIIWDNAISLLKNPAVLHCNCDDGEDNVRFYVKQGLPKENIVAVDETQGNLDLLKSDGFKTMKADLSNSQLVDRLKAHKFDVIVFPKWESELPLSATQTISNLVHLLNPSGILILVTGDVKSPQRLQGQFAEIYKNLSSQFAACDFIRSKKTYESYFTFWGVRS